MCLLLPSLQRSLHASKVARPGLITDLDKFLTCPPVNGFQLRSSFLHASKPSAELLQTMSFAAPSVTCMSTVHSWCAFSFKTSTRSSSPACSPYPCSVSATEVWFPAHSIGKSQNTLITKFGILRCHTTGAFSRILSSAAPKHIGQFEDRWSRPVVLDPLLLSACRALTTNPSCSFVCQLNTKCWHLPL